MSLLKLSVAVEALAVNISEVGYIRKLHACNRVLVLCRKLKWIFIMCTDKL